MQTAFIKIADRLAQPDADVRKCLAALQATARRYGVSEAQIMRFWRRWTTVAGRRFV